MLGLILSLVGGLGGLGAIGACVFIPGASEVLMGVLRSIGAVLAKIPPWAYAVLAVVGLIAFLYISRSHLQAQVKADKAAEAIVCHAVRDVAGRPHQDCRLSAQQIRAFGKTIATVEGAMADQNARIRALGQQNAALQAAKAKAEKIAVRRSQEAQSVSDRLMESSKHPPAKPCPVSKALEEQWK